MPTSLPKSSSSITTMPTSLLSPGHFFKGSCRDVQLRRPSCVSNQTKQGRGSLQRLANAGLLHPRGAETCPLSALTWAFFSSPQKCVRERATFLPQPSRPPSRPSPTERNPALIPKRTIQLLTISSPICYSRPCNN